MSFNLIDVTTTEYSSVKETNISSTDKTYFFDALECCSKIANSYRQNEETLYRSIKESNDIVVIRESFENFFKAMIGILADFDKSMTTMSSDFSSSLMKRTSQDEFILKDKDLYLNYPNDKRFIMKRYKYINLEPGTIPKINITRKYFEEEYPKLEKILSDRYSNTQSKITALIYEYNSCVDELRGGFYDRFRAEMIGLENQAISKQDFTKALFRCFRHNEKLVFVMSKDIKEAYIRFANIREVLEQIKKERTTTAKEYELLKRNLKNIKFERLVSAFGAESELLETKFDIYIKCKTDQLMKMCEIHMLAYASKLDALSSSYLQDRSLLLEAKTRLSEIEDESIDIENPNDMEGR